GGILDGRAGFTWCVLQAFYEYLILLKVWELQNDQSIAPTASAIAVPPASEQTKTTQSKAA
ncbi:MAG: glycosyltransferase family 2 protein, partial [Cyanobacteria bacterium J06635_11]